MQIPQRVHNQFGISGEAEGNDQIFCANGRNLVQIFSHTARHRMDLKSQIPQRTGQVLRQRRGRSPAQCVDSLRRLKHLQQVIHIVQIDGIGEGGLNIGHIFL